MMLSFFLGLLQRSICRNLSANVTDSGGLRRRLAMSGQDDDSDLDELESILEDCVDMDEERGLLHSLVVPPESSPLESASKKARLLLILHEAASSFEQEKRLLGRPFTAPNFFYKRVMASYSHPLSSPPGMGGAGSSATSDGADYVPAAIRGAATSGASFPQASGKVMIIQLPGGVDEKLVSQKGPTAVSTRVASIDAEQTSSSATPSTQLQAKRVSKRKREDLENHAFFRLPVVDNSTLREFNLHSGRARPRSSSHVLSTAHDLLARPALSASEAELLMSTMELLVSYTRWGMGRTVSSGNYSHLLRQMGLYFIILDAVVSARQILGPKMVPERWWPSFVASIPTESYLPESPTLPRIAERYTYQLIKRLRPALKLLMAGIRPSVEDVVSIKRLLFCSQKSLAYFKGARWNAWRDDERKFCEAKSTSSEASDDGDGVRD
ncbi:hypothetical protein Emag_007644 [Eimeria magna]